MTPIIVSPVTGMSLSAPIVSARLASRMGILSAGTGRVPVFSIARRPGFGRGVLPQLVIPLLSCAGDVGLPRTLGLPLHGASGVLCGLQQRNVISRLLPQSPRRELRCRHGAEVALGNNCDLCVGFREHRSTLRRCWGRGARCSAHGEACATGGDHAHPCHVESRYTLCCNNNPKLSGPAPAHDLHDRAHHHSRELARRSGGGCGSHGSGSRSRGGRQCVSRSHGPPRRPCFHLGCELSAETQAVGAWSRTRTRCSHAGVCRNDGFGDPHTTQSRRTKCFNRDSLVSGRVHVEVVSA